MAISEARHRANEKYNAKAYDNVTFRVPKGYKATMQEVAAKTGESVNSFIYRLVSTEISRIQAEQ